MSLFIEVYVGNKDNKKLVAYCHAYNNSNLADISDYKYTLTELGAHSLGIPYSVNKGEVKSHSRKQTVWSLVEKIAAGHKNV